MNACLRAVCILLVMYAYHVTSKSHDICIYARVVRFNTGHPGSPHTLSPCLPAALLYYMPPAPMDANWWTTNCPYASLQWCTHVPWPPTDASWPILTYTLFHPFLCGPHLHHQIPHWHTSRPAAILASLFSCSACAGLQFPISHNHCMLKKGNCAQCIGAVSCSPLLHLSL